ncbi:eppin-like [Ostrea edulis]|uniref:eppin-like n=1 Tax=Ostrea edulis TaxID=37623 RepID=UPI0024AECBEF|nr:eppin-like [Ostrea edulis]
MIRRTSRQLGNILIMQLPILISVLTVAFAGSYGPGILPVKPGQCPSDEGRAFPCVCLPGPSECSNDYDCAYGLKCCPYGCSCLSYCVRPVFGPGPQPGPRPGPQQDVCSQPQVVGPCAAAFRNWWYNRFTNRCEVFIYGGCQGNENNFVTEAECLGRCRRNRY